MARNEQRPPAARRASASPWNTLAPPALAVLSVACTAAGIWLYRDNRAHGADMIPSAADTTLALAYPAVGAFLLRRRPGNAAGWVLVSTSLLGLYILAGAYAVRGLVVEPDGLPGATAAAWLATWGGRRTWRSRPSCRCCSPTACSPTGATAAW